MYSGKADWGIIKDVRDALKIPVIGNGDISTPEAARTMLRVTGCDAVMIGRAVQGKPWLFADIMDAMDPMDEADLLGAAGRAEAKIPFDATARLKTIFDHIDMAVEYYGERNGVLIMRKHAAWYLKGGVNSTRFKERVFEAVTAQAVKDIICEALTP